MDSHFIDLLPGKPDSIKQIKDELKKHILADDIKGFLIFFKNIYNELNDRNLKVNDLFIAISSLINGYNITEEEKNGVVSFIIKNKNDFNKIIHVGILNGFYRYSILEKLPGGFYENNAEIMLIFKSLLSQFQNLNIYTNFFVDKSFEETINHLYRITGNEYYKLLLTFIIENKNEPFIYEYISSLPLEHFNDINFISNNWESIRFNGIIKKINKISDIQDLKNILCLEIYHIEYKHMMQMYYQYYVSSSKDEQLSEQLYLFEEIMLSKTKEDLIDILNRSNSIISTFTETYNHVYDFLQKDMKESYERESKMSNLLTSQNYRGVNVWNISSYRFHLIIHNISAALHHKPDLSDINFWENDDKKGSITISCSEISERYLGHLTRSNNEVFFGFSNLNGDNIFYSVDHDSQIPTGAKNYDELHSGDGGKRVFSASALTNNSFFEYNEVVINRYVDQTKSKKILPNYIVVFDDINLDTNYNSINEDSIRFAKHFNIPILYINVKKTVNNNIKNIIDALHNTSNAMELLKNINDVFSFIGGIKFSSTIKEIDEIDWYSEILQATNSVIGNENMNNSELIALLMILERIPNYKRGITSTFSGGTLPEMLVEKFNDFSIDIGNIINNCLYGKEKLSEKQL